MSPGRVPHVVINISLHQNRLEMPWTTWHGYYPSLSMISPQRHDILRLSESTIFIPPSVNPFPNQMCFAALAWCTKLPVRWASMPPNPPASKGYPGKKASVPSSRHKSSLLSLAPLHDWLKTPLIFTSIPHEYLFLPAPTEIKAIPDSGIPHLAHIPGSSADSRHC